MPDREHRFTAWKSKDWRRQCQFDPKSFGDLMTPHLVIPACAIYPYWSGISEKDGCHPDGAVIGCLRTGRTICHPAIMAITKNFISVYPPSPVRCAWC